MYVWREIELKREIRVLETNVLKHSTFKTDNSSAVR